MSVESPVNDLAQYKPAKQICERYPNLWKSPLVLSREARQREFNGMIESGACIQYRRKLLFHEDRLLEWFEQRHARSA